MVNEMPVLLLWPSTILQNIRIFFHLEKFKYTELRIKSKPLAGIWKTFGLKIEGKAAKLKMMNSFTVLLFLFFI
jgi:hypothetical protein